MAAAAQDRTNWSQTKSLIDFGASIGLSLDNLSSTDELQGRLDQISRAWNDLPIHERQRLDPPKNDLSGRFRAMAAYHTDDEVEALIRAFRYEMPEGDLPSADEIVPIIRKAGLLNQLEALTRWIEPRAEITSTGVLRPAAARQAFDDLGLVAWMREWYRHDYSLEGSRPQPKEMEAVLDTLASTQPWRSARDCLALDRLWNAALTCRVIRMKGRWAYPSWPKPLDDEGIVNLAIDAGLDLLFAYLDDEPGFGLSVLGYALLRSYVRGPRPIPLDEIEEFALNWMFTPSDLAMSDQQVYRRYIRSSLRRALYSFDDLGIFSQTKNDIALTAWGDVFVSAWLSVELAKPDDDH